MINELIVNIVESAKINCILSVPCNMIAGILTEVQKRPIQHIPVCREEEGVGIAAGAALAGKKPMLLMQNSGLGNSINALISLTSLYKLPLFILMSHRGGQGEKISAQVPMGEAVPILLGARKINYMNVKNKSDLGKLGPFIKKTFEDSCIHAALLSKELWNEA